MRECKQKSAKGISSGAFLLLPMMMMVLLLRISRQQAHSFLLAPPPSVALLSARQECRRLSRYDDRHASSFLSLTTSSTTSSANPRITKEWNGASNSSFAKHVILEDPDPIMAVDAVDRILASIVLDNNSDDTATTTSPLNASRLIALGSVWYLPSYVAAQAATTKPTRLPRDDFLLQRGDYLRVHHDPRRFPAAHAYDWGGRVGDGDSKNKKDGVIVAADKAKGWLVLDKPANVPVHPTVDNQLENVAACVREARHNNDDNDSNHHIYVATPQRLDINTSGLLVVATSKPFAAYFASLLRSKTKQQLVTTGQDGSGGDGANNNETTSCIISSSTTSIGGIHKVYRCLVCLVPPPGDDGDDDTTGGTLSSSSSSSWSVNAVAKELQSYAETGKIVRHYLEPSIRAPKRFVAEPPPDEDWPECLLKIRTASPVYALVGNKAARNLRQSLWKNETLRIQNCAAVMELEIELLTGRTHQIRGQCAVVGCPLVGDVQYGGARTVPNPDRSCHNIDSERLALQCCELDFLDPELHEENDGSLTLKRGSTWNRFCLERAWWTPLLERYKEEEEATRAWEDVTTTSAQDNVVTASESSSDNDLDVGAVHYAAARPELLPPRVQLSPGQHKYVLIRATHPGDAHQQDVQWFVKSAAPSECGGPYHGNVAQDLREWIEASGYEAVVMGGGRINYRRSEGRAVVYGFSYGFGKGDHAKAAALIAEWSDGAIEASYDNAEGLY